MAKADRSASEPKPRWAPNEWALWDRRWVDPQDAGPTTVLLQHPTAPFLWNLPKIDDVISQQVALQEMAWEYLNETKKRRDLGFPPQWLSTLETRGADSTFAWAPIQHPAKEFADPGVSFSFERYSKLRGKRKLPIDRTVILLAAERRILSVEKRLVPKFIGSGFGIQVVLHMRRLDNKRHEVRITGCSACLPFGPYLRSSTDPEPLSKPGDAQAFFSKLVEFKPDIERLFAFEPESTTFRGIRLAGSKTGAVSFELRGTALARKTDREATPYAFIVTGIASDGKTPGEFRPLRKQALVAHATPGMAKVFLCDPASHPRPGSWRGRRPNRGQALDRYRDLQRIVAGANDPLAEPGLVKTLPSRFVWKDKPYLKLNRTKRANLPGSGPPVLSDDFSGVNPLWNLRELFWRFRNYGIPLSSYFRTASLPLKAMYRSGIRPGPGNNGQTVNARVLATGWAVDFFGPTKPGERPTLELHFGLATLAVRERSPWNRVDRSPAEPFGIAGDSRWVWHEIGHVLLMAAVGELEFRFAHSPGDALAAIVADPGSALAGEGRKRGETFPFVTIPRRHDRCVLHGWSWGGSLHRALRLLPDNDRDRFKAYWSEQILSSSLFRLYLSIGGDTDNAGLPARLDRESASHYVVYLIIKAIGLLPPAWMKPTNHPEEFVAALIEADIGTQSWTPKVLDGTGGRTQVPRVGGCVHKVIRWAFEAQGMFAADPQEDTNGPGLSPDVDIFIADQRPQMETTVYGDVTHGPGTYVPVSLDWGGTPSWHSPKTAIEVTGGQVFVTVGNRGRKAAKNVKVRVWCRNWPASSPPPTWKNGAGWTPSNGLPVAPQDVAPGAAVRFGPFTPVLTTSRYIVLAEATCDSDFANSDPFQTLPGNVGSGTGLPSSWMDTPLVDLVANDNNLGLRVFGV